MYTGTIPDCRVAGIRRAIKSTTPSTKHKAEPSPSTKHKAEPHQAQSRAITCHQPAAIRTQAPITHHQPRQHRTETQAPITHHQACQNKHPHMPIFHFLSFLVWQRIVWCCKSHPVATEYLFICAQWPKSKFCNCHFSFEVHFFKFCSLL